LRTWEPLFDLSAPFENLSAVFDPARVRVAGKTLLPVSVEPKLEGPPVVRTRVSGRGNVQLEAIFEPGWTAGPIVGLMLQAGSSGAYEFHLSSFEYSARAAQDLDRRDPLAVALQAHERVYVSICRDGVVLAQTQLLLAGDELRLVARRVGNEISLSVNKEPALVFRDLFAPMPVGDAPFGVVWPTGVPLRTLRADRQALPLEPSPQEKGDELFASQRFDEARAFYLEHARQATDPESAAQAKFKAALCLYEAGHKEEASAALRELGHDNVPALARLWLWALRDGRVEEAGSLYEQLPKTVDVAQLVTSIPAEQRKPVLDTLRLRGPRWRSVWVTEGVLERLLLAKRVEELLNESAYERRQTTWKLIDNYRVINQNEQARLRMSELLREEGIPADERVTYLADLSWMQIEAGRIQEARADIDRELATHSEPEYLRLYLERARLLAAEKKWSLAEKAADEYLARFKPGEGAYADHADACLLKGFLREEQGDPAGAKEAWRRGLLRDWPGGLPALPQGRLPSGVVQHQFSNGHNFNFLLSSLVGDMTEREVETYLMHLMTGTGFAGKVVKVLSKQNLPTDFVRLVMLGNCADPRGKGIARRMVYRQIDFRGYYIDPFRQSLAVAFRLGAITGPIRPEVDELIWVGAGNVFKAFDDGRIDPDMLGDLLQLWHGRTGEPPAETWAQHARKLEPDLRTPCAYLFGRRYLVLKRPGDARPFLQEVAADTRPEFKVERQLALEELHKLAP
jgi:tetratricopeptide (TPR) repeat protein